MLGRQQQRQLCRDPPLAQLGMQVLEVAVPATPQQATWLIDARYMARAHRVDIPAGHDRQLLKVQSPGQR